MSGYVPNVNIKANIQLKAYFLTFEMLCIYFVDIRYYGMRKIIKIYQYISKTKPM